MATITYELPSHWACYLFYGDATCFDYSDDGKAEQAIIDQIIDDIGLGDPVAVSDQPSFVVYHDAEDYGVLASDCLIYTFLSA